MTVTILLFIVAAFAAMASGQDSSSRSNPREGSVEENNIEIPVGDFNGLLGVNSAFIRRDRYSRQGRIFPKRVGDHLWFSELENPCYPNGADLDEDLLRQLKNYDTEKILSFRGRKRDTQDHFAQRLLHLLHVERHVEGNHCSEETLTSLPDLPDESTLRIIELDMENFNFTQKANVTHLKDLYRSFLWMSIHFRYLAEDWSLGRQCASPTKTYFLSSTFQRLAERFQDTMCFMMIPSHPAHTPTEEMISEIYNGVASSQVYSYRDCSMRRRRDCSVFSHAKRLLETIHYHLR